MHSWSPSEKSKGCAFQKGETFGEKAKGNFSKITETARWEPPRKPAYSEHSIAIHSISMAGYVISVLGIVRAELCAREASSFCVFWTNDLLRIHIILLFFDLIKRLFFEMCLVRSTIANLSPIMIHFNALDFKECRSEEVMFLLTLSVYISQNWRKSEINLFNNTFRKKKIFLILYFDLYLHIFQNILLSQPHIEWYVNVMDYVHVQVHQMV